MIMNTEVVVVGAGVIGCAIGYFLCKEGVSAVIVEKDSIASHASGCSSDTVSPIITASKRLEGSLPAELSLVMEGFEMHKRLYQELPEETGLDYHFRLASCLKLAFTEAEANELRAEVDRLHNEGFEIRWLERGNVISLDSRISPRVIGAAYWMEHGQIDGYQYVLALAQGAEKFGALIYNREVTGLERKGGRVTGVTLSSGDIITCERVILAHGPWAGLASTWVDFPIPVRPVKGQGLRLRVPGPPFMCPISWKSSHLATKNDGLVWTGRTEEDVGFDEQPTVEARDSIMEGLIAMVPVLEEAELVLQTACLRPVSPDDLPIIGEVPNWQGVYLATGVGSRGILLSGIIGRIITDLLVKGNTQTPIGPFSPSRFASENEGLGR